jgi:hypothetical protein
VKSIPVIESAPWPAPVKSAVAGVMPVDESFPLLKNKMPASASASAVVFRERHVGQRNIDNDGKGGDQKGEPQSSQFEHRALLF